MLISFITIYILPYLLLFIKRILFFRFQKWIRHSYNFTPQSDLYTLPKRPSYYGSCQKELGGDVVLVA